MALRYTELTNIKTYIGVTGSTYDTILGTIGEAAESIFDQLIGSPAGLITSTKTEVHKPVDYSTEQQGYVFYLKTYLPTAITTVNGTAVGTLNTDYILEGRRLEFKTGIMPSVTFPYHWTVVYTSGYASLATIPNDIKQAIYVLVKAYWQERQASGIASFKQDLLSVNYDKGTVNGLTDPTESTQISATVAKYKIPYFYAT